MVPRIQVASDRTLLLDFISDCGKILLWLNSNIAVFVLWSFSVRGLIIFRSCSDYFPFLLRSFSVPTPIIFRSYSNHLPFLHRPFSVLSLITLPSCCVSLLRSDNAFMMLWSCYVRVLFAVNALIILPSCSLLSLTLLWSYSNHPPFCPELAHLTLIALWFCLIVSGNWDRIKIVSRSLYGYPLQYPYSSLPLSYHSILSVNKRLKAEHITVNTQHAWQQ
jgi:hypothetical protein